MYYIRRATEEEKNVLSCKRIEKDYDPSQFTWSSKFLDGETKPFTPRYDSLEKHCYLTIKAKEIFKPNVMELKSIK
jgi:hypothetical protein